MAHAVAAQSGRHDERLTFLDAAAVAVGAGLALWTTVLAPIAGGSALPLALVWAVYPTMDALLLVLCVHLALRLGVMVPAMRWLVGTYALLLALDIVNSVIGILTPPGENPLLMGLYRYLFLGLLLAATHPSIARLSQPVVPRHSHRRGSRRTALILFTTSPALLAVAMPRAGPSTTPCGSGWWRCCSRCCSCACRRR